MHAKSLITTALATLAVLGGGAAFAGEATPDYPTAFTSTLTRAEVRAAAIEARAAGRVAEGERSVVVFADAGMTKTRAQVRAETLEAIRLGAIGYGEKNVFPTPAQLESIRLAGLRALPMELVSR